MDQVVQVIEPAIGIGDRPSVQLGLHVEYPLPRLIKAGPRCARIHERPSRSALKPRSCWGPSPCGRLSRPPTTTAPPSRSGGVGGRHAFPAACIHAAAVGTTGSVPTFTANRLTGEVPNYAPAASPRLRRGLSAWPPCQRHKPAQEFPGYPGARRNPALIRQVGAGGIRLRGVQSLVPHVHRPSCLPVLSHLTVLTDSGVIRAASSRSACLRRQPALGFIGPPRRAEGGVLSSPHG